MCLEDNVFNLTHNIILYGSLVLGFLYISILILKKIKKKKILLNILLTIICILIVNTINFLLLKKCDDKNNLSTTTKTTLTSNEKNTNATTTVSSEVISTSVTTNAKTTTTTTTAKLTTKITTTTAKSSTKEGYVGTSSKGYTITYKNGAYYVDNYLIVNKTYKLDKNFVPLNPYKSVPSSGFARDPLDKDAYNAWNEMLSDSKAIGLNLWAQSGYRSYSYQSDLYNSYVKRKGKAAADTSSARPGNSEHQTGLAFDLNTITTGFKDTKEGIWIANNCYLYGYILRYPEGSTSETGYIFEPWHIRYVGKDLAKKLYNSGSWITMENYFGLTSVYPD